MESLGTFNQLPAELRRVIFENIDKTEILKCTQVSKQWRKEIEDTRAFKDNFAQVKQEYHRCYPAMVQARNIGTAMALGITMLGITSLATSPKRVPRLVPGILISGGISGAVYALGCEVERYKIKTFFTKTGIGALTFTISNISQAIKPSRLFSNKHNLTAITFNQICSSFVSYATSETLRNSLLPSLKDSAIHLVGSLCGSFTVGLIDQCFKGSSQSLLKLFGRQFMMGSTLAGIEHTTKAVLTNKTWDKRMVTDLVGQMVFAGTLRGVIAIAENQCQQEILRRRLKILNKAPDRLKELENSLQKHIKQHYKQVISHFGPQVNELLQNGWTPKGLSKVEFIAATELLATEGQLEFISPEGECQVLSDPTLVNAWNNIVKEQEALISNQNTYIETMDKIKYECSAFVNYALSHGLGFEEGTFQNKGDVFRHLYEGGVLHVYEPAPIPPIDIKTSVHHYDVPHDYAHRNLIEHYLLNDYVIKDNCNGNVDAMLNLLHRDGKLVFYIKHTLAAAGCKIRYDSNIYYDESY